MPPWVSFSAATRTFSGTPGTGDLGSIDILVTAKDSANASVSDVVRLTVAPPDTVPPAIVGFAPIDDAFGVSVGTNIEVTFGESITRGNGSIAIRTSSGVVVEAFDVASSNRITISGSKITIDPTLDLAYNTGYTLDFASGSVKDLSGNSFAGSNAYNLTTKSNQSLFEISRLATAGGYETARIYFKAEVSDGEAFLDFTYVNNRWVDQYNTAAFEWEAAGIDRNSLVQAVLSRVANTLKSTSEFINRFGINEQIDLKHLGVLRCSPSDEAANVGVSSDISVVFDKSIRGAGLISLINASGTVIERFDTANGSRVTIKDNVLTIDPASDLAFGTGYRVEFADGSLIDALGNLYAGTTNYNFTTAALINSKPAGTVTLTGTPAQSQTLTAANNLTDPDGLGTISYQWKADGVAINAATGNTLTLTEAQVGKTVTVTASYTDGHGTAESVTSPTSSSSAVANITDAPVGSISITGTPTQGQTLTVSNTLADLDGLGALNYLWKSDGVAIPGETLSSMTLSQAQVGKPITVAISYADGHGTAESVASTATGLVANVNDAPTGTVTISGTATHGQLLTVSNTLADPDGLGTISYQWKAAGVNIAGATTNTYTLTQAEVGKLITVIASYTDALGTAESKISGPTSTVAATSALTGSTGNDSLTSGTGNDTIDGGAGTDAVVYSGGRASFSLTKAGNGFTVTDNTGAAGSDSLQNIERIKFSDGSIALDVGAAQSAGRTAMLLGAVLPGKLVFDASKQSLLGAAIDLFDQGFSLPTLSGAVMRLPIWDVLTGKATPTNTDIATYLLTNVNGAAPDGTTLASAVASLNTETDFATQGNFLWHLAESTANQTRIDLVGLASTGLAFTV
jgi:hypothetical protein